MIPMPHSFRLALVLSTSFLSSAALAQSWEVLVSTLGPVPGVPGAAWVPNQFNNPTIDADGRVVFRGQIGGKGITLANSRLVMKGEPGAWTIVARDGSPVPGGNPKGYVFNQTSGLNGLASSNNISANGGVLVSGNINGPGVTAATDTAMFFVSADGVASLLVRESDPLPGGSGAIMTAAMTAGSGQRTSDAGASLFSTNLSGGDVSGTTNNQALVRLSPSGNSLVFRKGSPAPGVPDATLTPSTFGLFVSGDDVAFSGTLVGGSVTTNDDAAALTSVGAAPGEVRMFAREGSPVPGLEDTIYKSGASFTLAPAPIVDGKLIFLADLAGGAITPGVNDRAILAENNGSVAVLVRRGDAVPGVADGVFSGVNTSSWLMTPNGFLAYQGILMNADGTPLSANATYVGARKADGSFVTICRQGDPAPGIEGGSFTSLNGSTSIAACDAGVVVFRNSVDDGSAFGVDGLWAWDESRGLRLIARTGDTNFTGAPVTQIALIGSTGFNGNGGNTGLNPSGTLVLRVTDANTMNAIARINLGPDEEQCPADLNADGVVDAADLSILLGGWGTPIGDIDGNGTTDANDLATLLAAWGPCA